MQIVLERFISMEKWFDGFNGNFLNTRYYLDSGQNMKDLVVNWSYV